MVGLTSLFISVISLPWCHSARNEKDTQSEQKSLMESTQGKVEWIFSLLPAPAAFRDLPRWREGFSFLLERKKGTELVEALAATSCRSCVRAIEVERRKRSPWFLPQGPHLFLFSLSPNAPNERRRKQELEKNKNALARDYCKDRGKPALTQWNWMAAT